MAILSLPTPFSALRDSLEGSLSGDEFSPPRFDVLPGSLSHVLIRLAEQEGVVLVLDNALISEMIIDGLHGAAKGGFQWLLQGFGFQNRLIDRSGRWV